MAAFTIIPDTTTSRFIDKIIAKMFLASSYERIRRSVDPPPGPPGPGMVRFVFTVVIMNYYKTAIGNFVSQELGLKYSHLY